MSRKHGRDKVRHEKPHEKEPRGSIVASFSEKINVDLKSTNDLMNWIYFGEDKKFYL